MKKIFIIILLFSSIIYSQSAGKTGLSFLKYGFGARNIAMGDAGAALATDVTALYYNPANLAANENYEILFMHNEWIADVRSEVLGTKFLLFGLPLAIGLNITSVADIPIREKAGEPDATFNANFFSGSISTGFNIIENLSTGFSVKYLYEGILNDAANGLAFDFGINYKLPVQGLSASASLRNIGSMDELRVEKTKLPSEIRVGPHYSFKVSDEFDISTAAEFMKYLDTDDTHLNFGGEIFYNNVIALRAGYQTGYEFRSFTGGIGLRWGRLNFDYAFLPFSLGMGSGNFFSIKLVF